MKISDVMRAAWIKRWGIVRVMREQNIAEHSFMVAMISEEICNRIGWSFNEGGALHGMRGYEVLRWALWHDMAEVFTGDIPTPTKLRLKQLAGAKLQQIEDELAPEVAKIRVAVGPLFIAVVKVADYLEAISFLQREGGNAEADDVRRTLLAQMHEMLSDWNGPLRRYESEIIELARDMGIDVQNTTGAKKALTFEESEKVDKPSCLDAAYERQAIMNGSEIVPVFPENEKYVVAKAKMSHAQRHEEVK